MLAQRPFLWPLTSTMPHHRGVVYLHVTLSVTTFPLLVSQMYPSKVPSGETATSNDDATTQLLVGDKKLWSTSIELVQPLSLSCTPPQEDFVIEMVMEQRMSRGSFGAIQINELS